MENRISEAMKDSERWLSSAENNLKAGNYDIALYSSEMSLEIAIKALLIKNGIDYPKKHDVIDQFRLIINQRNTDNKLREKADNIIKTFSQLLDYRNIAGYNFGELKLDDNVKNKTEELIKETKAYIELIESIYED